MTLLPSTNLSRENLERLAQDFLSPLLRDLTLTEFDLANYDIDHLCWRTSTTAAYEDAKSKISGYADLLSEVAINGRLIASYQLWEPISYDGHTIATVEVPSPKPGRAYSDGFEHIEVVVDVPFDELCARYGFTPSLSLPSDFNPELTVPLASGTVKFHYVALADVIRIENQEAVISALRSLDLFPKLAAFTPHLSGSRLIGMHLDGSDVDILCKAEDFEGFRRHVSLKFPDLKVSWEECVAYGIPSLVGSFESGGVSFQLFAQNLAPCRQVSNLHYMIESRLLKVFGKNLGQEVLRFKKQGYATEPAFAKSLGIGGDPYQALLELQKLPESRLISSYNVSSSAQ